MPDLVGVPGAVPDLQLGTGCRRPARVVETLAGLWVVEGPVGLGYEDLSGRVVAVVEIDRRAVRGTAAVDVHALAEGVQRAARLDHGPLLGRRSITGVDLDRVEVRGAG